MLTEYLRTTIYGKKMVTWFVIAFLVLSAAVTVTAAGVPLRARLS
jgi:hypothetical protein